VRRDTPAAPDTAGGPPASVEIRPADDWKGIEGVWSDLLARSGSDSFYLGPYWLRAWLEVYGARLRPSLLLVRSGGEAVGACLLIARQGRVGPVRVRRLYLNSCPEAPGVDTYPEYNAPLAMPGWHVRVATAIREHLATHAWDEFIARACRPEEGFEALRAAFHGCPQRVVRRRSCYVDLAAVRRSGKDYEAVLSGNTRAQLRRSLKMYAQAGATELEAAPDVASALAAFEEMVALHREVWSRRGERGAFSTRDVLRFHRLLIAEAFPGGSIQMLRLRAAGRTIGILYNFVHAGRVYAYQSGFAQEGDNRLKPGLAAHASAIRFCLARGLVEYDFLVGEQRYKESLATGSREQIWVTVERPGWKRTLLSSARTFRQAVAGHARG
jgi:CelD/BcsL family acetyltransferase involved in cellulose biosynthesis